MITYFIRTFRHRLTTAIILIAPSSFSFFFAHPTALAGSATWKATPPSGNWNHADNWKPRTIPNGSADIASFTSSSITDISLSAFTQVNAINFNSSAGAFTITVAPGLQLSISGSGISNSSASRESFIIGTDAGGNAGSIQFTNSATTSETVDFTNNGGLVGSYGGGNVQFSGTSSPHGYFLDRGSTVAGASGGSVFFLDNSAAGSGSRFLQGGGEVSQGGGGYVEFVGTSSAYDASFTNNGGMVNDALGGLSFFVESSNAGTSTFINNSGQTMFAAVGITQFTSNATAANGTFINNGGFVNDEPNFAGAPGGVTNFYGSSSASSGVFTNNGGQLAYTQGGATQFFEFSTAGYATIEDKGGLASQAPGGVTRFSDNASADSAYITNGDGAVEGGYRGTLEFSGSSTAANATIVNDGGETRFEENAFAGNAFITTNGGLFDTGATSFSGYANAGNGTFVVNGTAPGGIKNGSIFFGANAGFGTFILNGSTSNDQNAQGARMYLLGGSSASDAVFTLNGTRLKNGVGGLLALLENSIAENARIIAKGGATGERGGGRIYFQDDSSGESASVEVYGNAKLDLSLHNFPGAGIGSIAGNGNIFLGGVVLAIGMTDSSSRFSGLIQDGGFNGGNGGAVVKVGAGTLTLTHANTYTGGTSIHGGTLFVENHDGSATGTAPVRAEEGRLGGRGSISGAVVVGAGNGPGAVISPGTDQNRVGTLTIRQRVTFKADATYDFQLNSANFAADQLIARGVVINTGAQFSFTQIGRTKLPVGTVLIVINNTATSPISGSFVNLADGMTFTSNSNSFRADYEGGDGNDLTFTVVQ